MTSPQSNGHSHMADSWRSAKLLPSTFSPFLPSPIYDLARWGLKRVLVFFRGDGERLSLPTAFVLSVECWHSQRNWGVLRKSAAFLLSVVVFEFWNVFVSLKQVEFVGLESLVIRFYLSQSTNDVFCCDKSVCKASRSKNSMITIYNWCLCNPLAHVVPRIEWRTAVLKWVKSNSFNGARIKILDRHSWLPFAFVMTHSHWVKSRWLKINEVCRLEIL